MLRIRQEHYDAYMEKKIGPACDQIMEALRKRLPNEAARYSEPELKSLCKDGIMRAARYGIGGASGVYHFVATMMMCGHDFDTDSTKPWAQQILGSNTLGEDYRSTLLALHVLKETGRGV